MSEDQDIQEDNPEDGKPKRSQEINKNIPSKAELNSILKHSYFEKK